MLELEKSKKKVEYFSVLGVILRGDFGFDGKRKAQCD